MKPTELRDIIDLAWEAVDTSKAGPMFMGKNENGDNLLNTIAVNVLYQVIQNLVPKAGSFVVSEPKENWET